MLVQRREIRGQIVRQHGKVLDAGVHSGAIRGRMRIERRSLRYVAIHVGDADSDAHIADVDRSEEHTSEPSHLVISYAVFCLKKKTDGCPLRPAPATAAAKSGTAGTYPSW